MNNETVTCPVCHLGSTVIWWWRLMWSARSALGFNTSARERGRRSYEPTSAPENRIGRASFSAAHAHIACPSTSGSTRHRATPARYWRTTGVPAMHDRRIPRGQPTLLARGQHCNHHQPASEVAAHSHEHGETNAH